MIEQFMSHVAAAYGDHSQKYAPVLEPILQPIAGRMIQLAGLKGGERILDLATGTGLIARTAAQNCDQVIGLDISLGILLGAKKLSDGNIPFVNGNALGLPFRDGLLDIVTCGLSLTHFPALDTALGEIRRVLRPDGLFVTSAWGDKGDNPSKRAAIAVRNRYLPGGNREALKGTLDEALWADGERGADTLENAGFTGVQISTQFLSGEYGSAEEATEVALAWPLTRYRISKLSPEEQQRLYKETAAAIGEVDSLRWQSGVLTYRATSP